MNIINGETFVNMLICASNNLENSKEEINKLNVFPVPDGDTGTNMFMTFSKATTEVKSMSNKAVGEIVEKLSSASLRGARGNSGVILSQFIRGIAMALKPYEAVDVPQFAAALKGGTDAAYRAVMKPTEGTILTVMRGLSDKALEICDNHTEFAPFLEEVLLHGNQVLKNTKEMLDKLKQANVVDAGGKGLITIIEGMLDYIKTGKVTVVQTREEAPEEDEMLDVFEGEILFGYCTEFIIIKEGKTAGTLRTKLEKIGESVVVVEDDEIIKVHVHTNNPDIAIGHALKLGQLINLKIDNMRHQNEMLKQKKQANMNKERKKYGFVAVASGDGFKQIYNELGISGVINGGQSSNPSTDDILEAAKSVNAENVFVFPNNKNIILAAEQAKGLFEGNLIIIPTTSMAQVFSLMLVFDENMEPEILEGAFKELLDEIKTGQVTYAVRDSVVDNIPIAEGDIMGMVGNNVTRVGNNINEVTIGIVDEMVTDQTGIITIYGGEEGTDGHEDLIEKLQEKYPDCDITYYKGGQPIYYYLVSAE